MEFAASDGISVEGTLESACIISGISSMNSELSIVEGAPLIPYPFRSDYTFLTLPPLNFSSP